METKKPGHLRRTLLVDVRLQVTFLAYTVAVAILGMLVNSLFQRIGFADSIEGKSLWAMLSQHAGLLTLCLAAFFIAVLAGLILSNRVAGPLYRLRRHMERVAQGEDVADIGFRDRDFCTDLAMAYNKVLARMRRSPKEGPDPRAG